MRAEIIIVGNEILQGRVRDTNSGWLAERLFEIGVEVTAIKVIADRTDAIAASLAAAERPAGLVLVTGGLGPTSDDVTRDALLSHFGGEFVEDPDVLADVEQFLRRRGKIEMGPLNRGQALVPEGCTVLRNPLGTAPGLWFERNGAITVAMPGVPFEMMEMVSRQVLPRLQAAGTLPAVVQRTALVHGVPEAEIASRLQGWEASLGTEITLSYLPSPGAVRVRLTARGGERAQLQHAVDEKCRSLGQILGSSVFGHDDDRMETVVGALLAARGATVATAESCTGGTIAALLTSVPGSSRYFVGSVVAYANEVKRAHLGVSSRSLDSVGAVSQEVAEQMARGARGRFACDYAVATSGIAGPDGGTEAKPVGTVWIAAASEETVVSRRFQFGELRRANIEKSAYAALNMLRELIRGAGQEERYGR